MARVIDTLRSDHYLIVDPDGSVSTGRPDQSGQKIMAYIDITSHVVGEPYTSMIPQSGTSISSSIYSLPGTR